MIIFIVASKKNKLKNSCDFKNSVLKKCVWLKLLWFGFLHKE